MVDETGMTEEEIAALDKEIADGESYGESSPDVESAEEKPTETAEAEAVEVIVEAATDETPPEDNKSPSDKSQQEFDVNYKANVPEDLSAKLDDIKTKMADLDAKYEDGDLDFAEYRAQTQDMYNEQSELSALQSKADMFTEMNQQKAQQRWSWEQETFLSQDSSEIYKNKAMYAALSSTVDEILSDDSFKQSTGPQILAEADSRVKALMGGAPVPSPTLTIPDVGKTGDNPPKAAENVFKMPKKPEIPKTLGNIPAVQDNGSGGEFAALEAMSDDGRELAMSKMTDAQLDRYLETG